MYVRSFICSFVHSFVRSSFRHRVKVFALKFIRPHILKTLWWISFTFGMMVDKDLKFLSAPSPPQGWPWGQGHGLRIFIKSQGQSFCVKVYKTSYFGDPLMDFIHIWHDGRYRSKVFISTIPTPVLTLESRSRTSNFHKKVRVKVFALKFIRSHILKALWWISFIFGMMIDIGLKFLSAPSPPRGWPWGQGHGLRIFIKKSKFFVFKFI